MDPVPKEKFFFFCIPLKSLYQCQTCPLLAGLLIPPFLAGWQVASPNADWINVRNCYTITAWLSWGLPDSAKPRQAHLSKKFSKDHIDLLFPSDVFLFFFLCLYSWEKQVAHFHSKLLCLPLGTPPSPPLLCPPLHTLLSFLPSVSSPVHCFVFLFYNILILSIDRDGQAWTTLKEIVSWFFLNMLPHQATSLSLSLSLWTKLLKREADNVWPV